MLAAALLAIALRPRRSTAAQAALVTKIGRFRYGDDLVDIRFQVHAADMADDGAALEPAVTRTLNGSVTRVQGRLERKSIGDAFRVLRVQEADGSWHDVDIWVPVRVEAP
ncbi:MAG: hypothetical protein IRY94_07450 [Rhodospirillaceae bacterium]|nr:hypothetical protein [Rhodospirillaceae bacterium]